MQFVELDLPVVPARDESMPMIQSDRTRASWTGGTNDAVVAGVVDSGFDHSHFDLNHTYAAGWDLTIEGNPWFDGLGHGSHVGGTMCGNGDVTEGYTGGAPGLGWGATGRLFVLKIFDEDGNWAGAASTTAILDRMHSSYTDGNGNLTPRPHVINHSYGSGPGLYFGSEATARALDADIHEYDQFHVFASHNHGPGPSTLSVQASTRNVFTVGNVVDYRSDSAGYPGSIWSTSSRGPTGDDRWKPNVAAPGRTITSVYGAGRIEAYRAIGSSGRQGYYFRAFTQGTDDYGQVEIEVGAGATRLTVAMYYHEEAASAGAGSALVNDLDMWIDLAPFANGGASGDYWSHQSPRDNSEVRMIENPPAGDWRIKVVPESATSSSRVGLCAIVSYGDRSPAATLDVSVDDVYVQPDDAVEITATVFNPEHVASAVHLTTSLVGPPYGDSPESVIVTLMDGAQSDLIANPADGEEVTLGDIGHGIERSVTWTRRWASEGVKEFESTLHGDNISTNGASDSVQITVDGTPPDGPTNFDSSSHDVGVPSCESNVQVQWSAATDALAGLDGYSYVWSANPGTDPNQTIDLGAGTTQVLTWLPDGTWYFHIRAADRSGNWGGTQHFGPIVVQSPDSSVYCDSTANSTGVPAAIWYEGSLSVSANDLVLRTSNLPLGQPCNFFHGPNEIELPFGNGYRCVGGTLKRLPIINTGTGELVYPVDNANLPAGGEFVPGESLKFQCWYRDPLGGGAFHNLSNGLSLRFCP